MKFVLLLVSLLLAVIAINAQAVTRYDIPWGNSEAGSSSNTINALWSATNYFVWRFLDANSQHSVVSTTTVQGPYSESQLTPGYDPNSPNNYPFRSEALTEFNSEGQQNYFAAIFPAYSNNTPPGVYYFRDQFNSNLFGQINLSSGSSESSVSLTTSTAASAAASGVIVPVSPTAATVLISSAPPASLLSPSQTPASGTVISFPVSTLPTIVPTANPSANPSPTAASATTAAASASLVPSSAVPSTAASASPVSSAAASASASSAAASVAASVSASASRAAFSSTPSSTPLANGGGGGNNGQSTSSLSASRAPSSTTVTPTPSASPCTKDTDGDGVPDCFDLCPRNKKKTAPSGPYGCSDTPKSSHTIIEFDFDILSPMNCTDLYGSSE